MLIKLFVTPQQHVLLPLGLDKWLPIRPAHKDDEVSGEVLVAMTLEKTFTATDPTTGKVCN